MGVPSNRVFIVCLRAIPLVGGVATGTAVITEAKGAGTTGTGLGMFPPLITSWMLSSVNSLASWRLSVAQRTIPICFVQKS